MKILSLNTGCLSCIMLSQPSNIQIYKDPEISLLITTWFNGLKIPCSFMGYLHFSTIPLRCYCIHLPSHIVLQLKFGHLYLIAASKNPFYGVGWRFNWDLAYAVIVSRNPNPRLKRWPPVNTSGSNHPRFDPHPVSRIPHIPLRGYCIHLPSHIVLQLKFGHENLSTVSKTPWNGRSWSV